MRIGFNGQTISGQKSGFGSYANNLLTFVPQLDPTIEYATVQPAGKKDLSTPQRLWWDQVGFPQALRNKKVDLIHQPSFSAPLFTGKKVVVTIHDIIPTLFPQNFALPSRLFFGRFMPFSYRFADHYITISEHSRQDLIKVVGLDPKKITVIPLAASPEYRPLHDPQRLGQVKQKYGITGPYFIHVSTLEPRKNLPMLVKAFAQALPSLPEGFQLVLTGKKGWGYEPLFASVHELRLEKQVIFTGYADLVDLPYLNNGAVAAVFPSLYEGFGLPPLEAMQCGTPVLSSNASSLPEVVGEAGILLSPTDPEAWSKAMVRIATDPQLQKQLSQAGRQQSQKFSWAEIAQATVKVYRSVIG